MRILKREDGSRRYPKAHADGFSASTRWVDGGAHGPEQRDKVTDEPIGACLEWQASRAAGYGALRVNGKRIGAHRHAWNLAHGDNAIPPGMHVLHRCDNRRCVNVEHLFLGTAQDNQQDASAKRRSAGYRWKGDANPHVRLSDAQVVDVRQRYRRGNGSELARELGVSPSLITKIVTGKMRADIGGPIVRVRRYGRSEMRRGMLSPGPANSKTPTGASSGKSLCS